MSINLKLIDVSKVDAKKPASFENMAEGLATKHDTMVSNSLMTLAFTVGRRSREQGLNQPVSFDKAFKAFADHHRAGIDVSGRKAYTTSTFETMKSAFGAIVEAGFHGSYDAAPIVDFVMDVAKGPWSKRGGLIRRILSENATELPSAEKLKSYATVKEQTLADMVERLADSVNNLTKVNKAKTNEELVNLIKGNPELSLAWAKAKVAMESFQHAAARVEGKSGDAGLDAAAILAAAAE